MPLHTHNGEKGVCQSFHHMIVGAALNIADSPSGRIHALVVRTVHRKDASVEPVQEGVFFGLGLMNLVAGLILMPPKGGKILVDVAAKENIDQLHSLTDSQNRLFVQDKLLQDGKLESVESGVYDSGAFVQLTEQPRINIPAAGKHKPVIAAYVRHMQGGDGGGAEVFECVFVVDSLVRMTGN